MLRVFAEKLLAKIPAFCFVRLRHSRSRTEIDLVSELTYVSTCQLFNAWWRCSAHCSVPRSALLRLKCLFFVPWCEKNPKNQVNKTACAAPSETISPLNAVFFWQVSTQHRCRSNVWRGVVGQKFSALQNFYMKMIHLSIRICRKMAKCCGHRMTARPHDVIRHRTRSNTARTPHEIFGHRIDTACNWQTPHKHVSANSLSVVW